MNTRRPEHLERDVDPVRDHVIGNAEAGVTLVEYGSYVCGYCRTANDVVRRLRDRFGDRMRYVYRHMPLTDRPEASLAAEITEYATTQGEDFWDAHDLLMRRGPELGPGELDAIVEEIGIGRRERWDASSAAWATARVREDALGGLRSGVRVTPTFFIDGRRYEGAWDEDSLAEAMFRSMGDRLHAASVDFARWAPSTGLLLLLMTVVAITLSNSPLGPAFLAMWETPAVIGVGSARLVLSLVDWVNHGLLTVFFLMVGLEIKRELTVGRLATPRAAALPIGAAVGGMIVPALTYLLLAPATLRHGWGVPIATDTAFAIAIIVLLGARVPMDLRVFLTAAVIVDDLVAIAVVAVFYTDTLSISWLAAAAAFTVALVILNRWHIYRAAPYAVVGALLWLSLHGAGVHATLAGVILAIVTPTLPPPNLNTLLAQAQAVIDAETRLGGEALSHVGPSEPLLRALDTIHDRLESPASKLLHTIERWSSYLVLPVFALANAGVVWSSDVLSSHGALAVAIGVALVAGKLVGILVGAWIAVGSGLAVKPSTYTWRQVAGAGALGGIGFTMSLFIAGEAFEGPDFAAAKIAILMASLAAGLVGTLLLWRAPAAEGRDHAMRRVPAEGALGSLVGVARDDDDHHSAR